MSAMRQDRHGRRPRGARTDARSQRRLRRRLMRYVSGGRRCVRLAVNVVIAFLLLLARPVTALVRLVSAHWPSSSLCRRLVTIVRGEKTPNQRALEWAQQQIPFYGVCNLTTDWTDGVALCTLVEAVCPGSCPSCDLLKPEKNLRNCVLGLVLMRKHLGIKEPAIKAEEIVNLAGKPGETKMAHLLSLISVAVTEKARASADRSGDQTLAVDQAPAAAGHVIGARIVRRRRTVGRVVSGRHSGAVVSASGGTSPLTYPPPWPATCGETDVSGTTTDDEDVEATVEPKRDIDAVAVAMTEAILQEVYGRWGSRAPRCSRRGDRALLRAVTLPSVAEEEELDLLSRPVSMPALTTTERALEVRRDSCFSCTSQQQLGNREPDRNQHPTASKDTATSPVGHRLSQNNTSQHTDKLWQTLPDRYHKGEPQLESTTICPDTTHPRAQTQTRSSSLEASHRRKIWLGSSLHTANWTAFDESDTIMSDSDTRNARTTAVNSTTTSRSMSVTESDDSVTGTPAITLDLLPGDVSGGSEQSRDPTKSSNMIYTIIGSPKWTTSDRTPTTITSASDVNGNVSDARHPGSVEGSTSPVGDGTRVTAMRDRTKKRRHSVAGDSSCRMCGLWNVFKPPGLGEATTKWRKSCSVGGVTSSGKKGQQRSASVDTADWTSDWRRHQSEHGSYTSDARSTTPSTYSLPPPEQGQWTWDCPAATEVLGLDPRRMANETTYHYPENKSSALTSFSWSSGVHDNWTAARQRDVRPTVDRRDQFEVFGAGLHYGYVQAKNNFQVWANTTSHTAPTVTIVGPAPHCVAETSVVYTGDNLYDVTYDVTWPGDYVIYVKWLNVVLGAGPFISRVTYLVGR